MLRRVLALAALLAASGSATAQSAGETALFLMTGRDGLAFGPTGVVVIEDATIPCVENPRSMCRYVTSITRLAPCRYETNSTSTGDPSDPLNSFDLGLIVDFSQVARIGFERSTAGAAYVDTAAFTGARGVQCVKGAAPWTCMDRDTVTPDTRAPVDQQRFSDAFAYMRRTFCPGRAY